MSKQDRMQQWIAAGYLKLADEMSLRKITVQKLCEYTEINRSTFYYHFSSIQDLIHWIYHSEVNEPVQRMIKADPRFQDKISESVLTSIYKRKDFWQRVLRLPGADEFIAFMLRDTMENWRALISAIVDSSGISSDELSEAQRQELTYIMEYYCYGHHQVCLSWMRSGMDMDPREVAELVDHIALNGFAFAVRKAIGE